MTEGSAGVALAVDVARGEVENVAYGHVRSRGSGPIPKGLEMHSSARSRPSSLASLYPRLQERLGPEVLVYVDLGHRLVPIKRPL